MNSFKKNIYKSTDGEYITAFNFTTACDSGDGGGSACCAISDYLEIFHCGDYPITIGSIFYSDIVGGIEVIGANLWYKEQMTQISYRLDNFGVVIGINKSC